MSSKEDNMRMEGGLDTQNEMRQRHPPQINEKGRPAKSGETEDKEVDDFIDVLSHSLDELVLNKMYRNLIENRPTSDSVSAMVKNSQTCREVDKKLRLIKLVTAFLSFSFILNALKCCIFSLHRRFYMFRVLYHAMICYEICRICFNCHLKTYITHSVDSLISGDESSNGSHIADTISKMSQSSNPNAALEAEQGPIHKLQNDVQWKIVFHGTWSLVVYNLMRKFRRQRASKRQSPPLEAK